MNKVERIIQDEIFNQNTVFVFPSQMATNRWMERATEICNVKAVAKERFLPWDSFKENSVRSKQQNKQAIPSTLRKMYASRLVSENADEKFLSYFIQT